MPCADRQLTDAEREAAFEQQRTGVQRGIRPFTGEATPEAIAEYLNREVFPVLKQARDKINEVYLPVVDNAPSANPLGFYFSETTTNADPTAGYIQLDNATQNIATTIRVSQQNGRDKDITTWLDVMSGSATSPLGVVTLSHAINPSRFLRFDLTSMTDQGAYWDLAVTAVESSHTNPFVEDDQIAIQFIPGVSSGTTVVAPGAAPSWDDVLTAGNNTGTNNPHVDAGQFLGFGAEGGLPASGQIRSSAGFTINVTGGGTLQSSGNSQVISTGATAALGATGAGQAVQLLSLSGEIQLTPGTFVSINTNSFLRFTESAASTPSMSAGQGLFWVRDDTPNTPMFTDDTNTDRPLLTAPVALTSLANQADDTFLANIAGSSAPPTAVALTTLAGSGLTGGADAILNVGAGTGITVNANDVAVTIPLTDGDKGHIVVSSSGTVWLWDTTISITGAQEIAPTGNLTLTVGADLLANATSGVFIGAAVSGSSVATGNIEHAGTADSLWNMQSGMNITLGGTALSGPGTAVGTGVLAVNADTGISLRAGHATANNTGAGDILANATSGIHLFAGATPQTAASGIQLTSDTVVDAQPTTDLRVGAGSGFNLRAGSTTLVSADDGDGVLQATGGIAIRAGTGTLGTVTGAADGTVSITASDDVTINPTDDLVLQTNGTTRARINAAGDWDFENGLDFDVTGTATIDATLQTTITTPSTLTLDGGELSFLTVGGAGSGAWSADVGTAALLSAADFSIVAGGGGSGVASITGIGVFLNGLDSGVFVETDTQDLRVVNNQASMSAITTRTNSTTALHGASATVEEDTWTAGTTYRFSGMLHYSRGSTATASNLQIDLRVAGTAQAGTVALATSTTNGYNGMAWVEGYVTCITTGASGTAIATARVLHTIPSTTLALQASSHITTFTLNTTVSNTLSLTSFFSAAVANLSMTWQAATITRMA